MTSSLLFFLSRLLNIMYYHLIQGAGHCQSHHFAGCFQPMHVLFSHFLVVQQRRHPSSCSGQGTGRLQHVGGCRQSEKRNLCTYIALWALFSVCSLFYALFPPLSLLATSLPWIQPCLVHDTVQAHEMQFLRYRLSSRLTRPPSRCHLPPGSCCPRRPRQPQPRGSGAASRHAPSYITGP